MAYEDVKRIQREMGLRKPLTNGLEALDSLLEKLDWIARANGEADGTADQWHYCLLPDTEVKQRKDGDFLYLIDGARRLNQ